MDENGLKITDCKAPDYILRAAWHAWRIKKDVEEAAAAKLPDGTAKIVFVADVCNAYIEWLRGEIQRSVEFVSTLPRK